MHKIALRPKELFKLWADGSGASVEEPNPECRDHASVLLFDSKDERNVIDHSHQPPAEGRTGVVNSTIFPFEAVGQLIGGQ